jgi:hypothetical protein
MLPPAQFVAATAAGRGPGWVHPPFNDGGRRRRQQTVVHFPGPGPAINIRPPGGGKIDMVLDGFA